MSPKFGIVLMNLQASKKMEEYATKQNLKRKSLVNQEIYLTDTRKTTPDKLKTVLRFQVEQK